MVIDIALGIALFCLGCLVLVVALRAVFASPAVVAVLGLVILMCLTIPFFN